MHAEKLEGQTFESLIMDEMSMDPPWETVNTVGKTVPVTIRAVTRVNSTTLATKRPEEILPVVKKKLLKKLHADIERANVIDIVSEPNGKGGLVFTATLKAMPRDKS